MNAFRQENFALRMEWGMAGVEHLAESVDCIIIVDVMSFSSCVSLVTNRGAFIYPWPWKDETAAEYGRKQQAKVASIAGGLRERDFHCRRSRCWLFPEEQS